MMEAQPRWKWIESKVAKAKTKERKAKLREKTSRAVTKESTQNLMEANRRERTTRARERTMERTAKVVDLDEEKDLYLQMFVNFAEAEDTGAENVQSER